MSLSTAKATDQNTTAASGFQEDLEQLRHVALFKGLDYECLKLLAMLCHRLEYTAGDQLLVQDEEDGCAFLLLSGTVSVIRKNRDTGTVVRRYSAGALVGSSALLGKMPRLFTVEALETTTALRLCRQQFQKTMLQFPQDMGKIAENLVSELTRWDQHLLAEHKTQEGSSFQGIGVSLI